MPKVKSDQHTSILEYALRHLEQEREEIQSKIDHIKTQLGQSVSAPAAASASVSSPAPAAAPATGKKRTLSASARKRIALAQKKRWAEHRKAKGKE